MGVFFKPVAQAADPVEELFRDALTGPPLSVPQAQSEAKVKAAAAKGTAAAVEPNLPAFASAGVVFLVLLVAAYLMAQSATNDGATETALDTLADAVRELLVAWSAAVLGLVGGEAVGAKTD